MPTAACAAPDKISAICFRISSTAIILFCMLTRLLSDAASSMSCSTFFTSSVLSAASFRILLSSSAVLPGTFASAILFSRSLMTRSRVALVFVASSFASRSLCSWSSRAVAVALTIPLTVGGVLAFFVSVSYLLMAFMYWAYCVLSGSFNLDSALSGNRAPMRQSRDPLAASIARTLDRLGVLFRIFEKHSPSMPANYRDLANRCAVDRRPEVEQVMAKQTSVRQRF